MLANESHEEDQRSFRRQFKQWRYPLSLNCHLCISEVIDRFTQVEKERGLRSRERKRRHLWILRHTIEALVCDLAHHHIFGHSNGIAISKSIRDLKKKADTRTHISRVNFHTSWMYLSYLS